MDSRIQAIMDQLNNGPVVAVEPEKKGTPAPPRPPTTFDAFLKFMDLEDWPEPLTSEQPLDLSDERKALGDRESIENELKAATPIDMQVLSELERRLDLFDSVLNRYAGMLLQIDDDEIPKVAVPKYLLERETLPLSVDKAFITEMAESDAVKAHPSGKRKTKDLRESIVESRKKKVDHCVCPGFRAGELTELPTQIEAPHILHRVTKAQDFNPGFRKFWKKIFLSEASVAVMQDTFWWIFLDKFTEEKYSGAMGMFFDRIADSFVALFSSVNPEIKDKVFQVYSDCLSQALFAAFYEAFPESLRTIASDNFRQYLCNLIYMWVTGARPNLSAHDHWNLNRIIPKQMRQNEDPKVKATRDLTMGNEQAKNYKLDMDDFIRTVDQLGQDTIMPGFSKITLAPNQPLSRDVTRLTHLTAAGGSKLSMAPSAPKMANCGSARKTNKESHVIGPGPELERVKFNLKGKSPLVAHFLYMKMMKESAAKPQKVRRTQVAKKQADNLPTYRDLINSIFTDQEKISKEYHKVCEETDQEILKIEKQQRETNRKIDKLQARLMTCKNSMEVKVMAERILDKREAEVSDPAVNKPSRK